ncbi:MAG: bacterial regulatory helix-turn-helix, lysR family protein [Collimonas fungivorans]|uniref:LysR family transcriptional regulator n=1 Tax=Collimonas fungivorans TaxID=158899 RepID=UPI0026EC6BC2|nr:LysR family transcriptional regulator [Collimonas fungivorans]MDB5767427.1 bacterial regulatory helix-turn-helix, lysR family protein [Collimonas fungivorans]
MDRVETMQVFVRVAETGSFTKAADGLGLPRATVSAAIQQLEASLGARLLQRTTRRVHLTQDGSALLERCHQLLSDFEEISGLFRQTPAQASGKLKVDVPSRLARLVVAPALPGFFKLYPDVELELRCTDRSINLVQEGVDCVVRVGQLDDSSLVARPLGQFELINCASPAYLQQHGIPSAPSELAQHWAVSYLSPTSGRSAPWEYVEDGVLNTVEMRSRIAVNNAETYIACCLAGLGLIQIPAYDVRSHIRAGELREVMPQARAAAMPVYALYPHRRHLSRRVQVFIDWMENLLLQHR